MAKTARSVFTEAENPRSAGTLGAPPTRPESVRLV